MHEQMPTKKKKIFFTPADELIPGCLDYRGTWECLNIRLNHKNRCKKKGLVWNPNFMPASGGVVQSGL